MLTEAQRCNLEARNYLDITARWMRRTADSLQRVGSEEAIQHAAEMRGAASMADEWVVAMTEANDSSEGFGALATNTLHLLVGSVVLVLFLILVHGSQTPVRTDLAEDDESDAEDASDHVESGGVGCLSRLNAEESRVDHGEPHGNENEARHDGENRSRRCKE
jgi:hypothetical protein